MTHALKEHLALVEAYTKHTHEAIDLLGKEMAAALNAVEAAGAQATTPGQDNNDLLAQLRAKADRIAELEDEVKMKSGIIEQYEAQGLALWYDPLTPPEDGTRCIVRTKAGATFMYEPVCGKWPDWVEKWMSIPE